jgi:biopolymer transport protein ExbB
VVAAAKTTLYADGEVAGTVNAATPALNSAATLGGENGATGFVGELDELEISKVARPIGFVKFSVFTQGTDKGGKLLAIGNDEERHSWFSGGFLGVILGSLTVDGWLVIGILVVMSAISWIVMVQKARYLRAVAAGNKAFLKEWNHIAADLGFLDVDSKTVSTLGGRIRGDNQKAVRQASVYRIFKCGAEEIRHRLAADTSGNAKVLSARSIQAIRASLDGAQVREGQKLNRRMVLLTIAISGGPFLGLLGTVVGVMITFAAIAAQGDVNVNAIAPGIAAALAATVAGLAVAIPALFGYNYLLSQVKDASSDMQVFIDEFVTKMAEYYGGRPTTSSRPNRFEPDADLATV